MRTEHVTFITNTIRTHADKQQLRYELLTQLEFNGVANRRAFPDRYGWTFPNIDAPDGWAHGVFCVETLAKQTGELPDDQRGKYIHAILWMCDRHMALMRTMPDSGERHRHVESELMAVAPGSMDIMSRVEIYALDRDL
jgi:hypothetical protein